MHAPAAHAQEQACRGAQRMQWMGAIGCAHWLRSTYEAAGRDVAKEAARALEDACMPQQ